MVADTAMLRGPAVLGGPARPAITNIVGKKCELLHARGNNLHRHDLNFIMTIRVSEVTVIVKGGPIIKTCCGACGQIVTSLHRL